VDVEAGSKNPNFIVGAFIAVDIKKSFNSQPIFFSRSIIIKKLEYLVDYKRNYSRWAAIKES